MMSLARIVYNLLLQLYPRQMRLSVGTDMRQMFDDLARVERARGRWPFVMFVTRTVLEAPRSAWISHRQWRPRSRRRLVPAVLIDLVSDLRLASRSLARTPGFASTVVLTLALGVGATTSVFSVVNAVLLRPLPYRDPESLVFVQHRATNHENARAPLAGADLADVAALEDQFASVAGTWAISTNLSGESARQVTLGWVTPDFFPLLGIEPYLGRWFRPDDVTNRDLDLLANPSTPPPGAPVVLSHALHQQRYGGAPEALGTTIEINGQSMIVIGVAPRGFRLRLPPDATMPEAVDAWTLFPVDPTRSGRGAGNLTTIARLAPGASIAGAQGTLDALADQLRAEYPEHAELGTTLDVSEAHADIVGPARPTLMALSGAVLFVLLIAGGNVATLLLVRATGRARELAIRAAIGGGRSRLLRMVFAETLALVALGTAAGIALAHWAVDALLAVAPVTIPFADMIGLDGTVIMFTLAVAAAIALSTGLAPAWQASRTRPAEALGLRVETGASSLHRVRFALVTAQVALSVVLLAGAGLMLRTLVNLQRVDLGFVADDVVTARVALPFFAYRDAERRLQFFDRLVRGVSEEPGVSAAGGVTRLPFADADGQDWSGPFASSAAEIEDWEQERAEYRPVLPGYLDAMRARLRQGRMFAPADNRPEAPLVVLVDDVFAERVWPDDDAVGRPIMIGALNASGTGSEPRWAEVVGVVGHLRDRELAGERRGTIFVPYQAFRWFDVSIVVRSELSAENVAGVIRSQASAIDRDVPVASVRPMSYYVGDALAPTRFLLTVLGLFAAMAIVLAAIGLYGVIAYLVRTRTTELGIRLAFGASPGTVARSVMLNGIRPALAGAVIGVPAAVAASQLIAHLLYGVAPSDIPTYLAIVILIFGVAVVASLQPAWRTTQIDPVATLRTD